MNKELVKMNMYSGVFNSPLYNGFKKYKLDCKYFVETGSHYGDGIAYAELAEFEKIFSCEFIEERYNYCISRFNHNKNIMLYHSLSLEFLKKIIPLLDEKTFFWLDAHDDGGGVPTFEELDLIKEFSVTNTIMIDDVPAYFGDGIELKEKLLNINPNYTIERWNTLNVSDPNYEGEVKDDGYTMVAYL